KLNQLSFIWDPDDYLWQKYYLQLKHYIQKFGHDHIPRNKEPWTTLETWLRQQRQSYQRQKLSKERVTQLNALPIHWQAKEAEWQSMFVALKKYKETYGHCHIPEKWQGNPQLLRWTKKQRKAKQQDKLPEKFQQRLESLGFIWDHRETLWEEMFSALAEFKMVHGHCMVPDEYNENTQLVWWVNAQRTAAKNSNLDAERYQRLDAFGFVWNPEERVWQINLEKLKIFHQAKGHAHVPQNWPEDPELSQWVATQRQAYMENHLDTQQIEQLNQLNFEWDKQRALVEDFFTALTDFKQRFGHCRVPPKWEENSQLGLWTQFQRQAKQRGTLDPERFQRLQALDFEWD
ncbi:helicase associated domain-containing protein, partial [Magnetococcales bacterium HHB-1]